VRWNLRDNVDQPYQVALGGEEGVRGYNEEDLPTSTTFVASQEARVNLPWFRPAVGLGLTGFFDVGRGWGDDVPFGVDTVGAPRSAAAAPRVPGGLRHGDTPRDRVAVGPEVGGRGRSSGPTSPVTTAVREGR
jgi:hypothetical protein